MSYQLITRGALIAALHAEAGNLSAAAIRLGVSREALRQRVRIKVAVCPDCQNTRVQQHARENGMRMIYPCYQCEG